MFHAARIVLNKIVKPHVMANIEAREQFGL
jgi:hypothetical protein